MFHPLRVTELEPITDDAVAVSLAVPPELRRTYQYQPGQHVALRRYAPDGREIRRTYSLCAPATPAPKTLRIGIRQVAGGQFSTHAVKELAVGDTVEVLPPTGRFVLQPRAGNFVAVVGGSGITPVLAMASTVLDTEPSATFCLVRSDRSAASTMFLEEVADLKDRYPDRFQLVHVFSREERQTGPASGRLDRARLASLLPGVLGATDNAVADVHGWYLCGPMGLVENATEALRELGVPKSRVHQEIFHAEAPPASTPVPTPDAATVSATLDGRSGNWPVRSGEVVLETVLRNRSDAPYACRGGVCGTCRARLLSGEVRMDRNFALGPEELDAGYILACQSHPTSAEVTVDFDA